MNVALVDVDGHNFPNLALMKISAWHKAHGDDVEWYAPLFSRPDKIYASKVFTFTADYPYFPSDVEIVKGGTGYNVSTRLHFDVESIPPDYSIYPQFPEAYGFLTRGCIRRCPWCIVPEKEGSIHAVSTIQTIAAERKGVVLMDNNFLAADPYFVDTQLHAIIRDGIKVDFNQGLDARLVDGYIAGLLAKIKWIKYPRFACDTTSMLPIVIGVVEQLRGWGYKGEVFVYILAMDVDSALERINTLRTFDERIIPFCQPYRDLTTNAPPSASLKRLARWCNMQSVRKTVQFEAYRG